jgi:hypothetical protein
VILAPQLGEERVERAFLSGELGLREPRQNVGGIDRLGRDDLQDRVLEKPLPQRGEFFLGIHLGADMRFLSYLVKTR